MNVSNLINWKCAEGVGETTTTGRNPDHRGGRVWVLGAMLMVVGMTLAACGGDSDDPDPCADTFCEYGVCNPETGECQNPESCGAAAPIDAGGDATGGADAGESANGGAATCLEGYVCREGSCVAEASCGDEQVCARGVCEKGACVDAETCEDRMDCRPGKGCSADGTCQNLCEETTCESGICNPETGECLNPQTCDPATEQEDVETDAPGCVEGYECRDPNEDETYECVDEETYCEQLDCDRGTCSFEAQRCVDEETCSEDEDCVEGNYCDTVVNECKNNVCNEAMTDCPRGTCEPSTGACVNPENCSDSEACLPDNVCVQGRCVPADDACGAEGCPGNQVCDYQADSLSAECQEAPGGVCRNAVDCTGNAVCRNGECQSPAGCSPDQFEPNDASLVDFLDGASGQTLEANLCGSGDVDRFSYDSDRARGSVVRGTLLVDLVIEPSDVGQGSATLTLTNRSGDILASQSTDRQGRVHLERKLSAGQFETFQFKVNGSNLNPAGLRYSLFAGIAPESVTQACRSRTELLPNGQNEPVGPTTGNTENGESIDVDATCADGAGSSPEQLYTFTLEEESYVNLQLRPDNQSDLTLSLRRQCASIGTEIGCANRAGPGGDEALGRRLGPGTYTAIVQGAEQSDAGGYELSYIKNEVVCSPAQNECVDSSTSRVCSFNGTSLTETFCTRGCDESTGRCNVPPGDNCYEAVDIGSSADDLDIQWGGLRSDYSPGELCGNSVENTGGPDAVYEVTVPAGETMEATLDVGNDSAAGALYAQQNCADPEGTCLAASDSEGPNERVIYENESGSDETFYLVADSSSEVSEGTGTLNVQTGTPVCNPDETTCDGNQRKRCRESGLGFDVTNCQYGCTNGECVPPPFDSCSGAVDLTGGGSETGNWDELSNLYDVSSTCVGDTTPGNEGVYSVDLASDEVATIQVTPSDSSGDPAIYVTSDCSSVSGVQNSCITGVDEDFGGDSETLNFSPEGTYSGTKTFYIFADADSTGTSGSTGQYTIDVTVQTQVCTPGDTQCASGNSSTLEYCGTFGLGFNQYSCQGSNTTCQAETSTEPAKCPDPTGDLCPDAIDLDKNGSITTSPGGSNTLELPDGTSGSCVLGDESNGDDTFFRVDLEQGDLLDADLSSSESEAQMYIMKNCQRPMSCQVSTPEEQEDQSLRYLAEQDETVYVVVDGSSFFGGFDGNFTLDLTTTPDTTCIPDNYKCTGPNEVSVCNSAGTGFANQFNCSNGCSAGACVAPGGNPPPQASCSTAPNIGNGIVVRDNWGNYSNNINVPSSACGAEEDGVGNESVYAVDVLPGEIVTAELTNVSGGFEYPILNILDDCSQPANSCVAGAGDTGQDTASVTYTAQSNTTLYVVADNEDSFTNSDDFRLTVEKQAPNCSPGSKYCTSNNQGLTYCTPQGLTENYLCSGQCQSGSCQNPTGNRCVDPLELTKGDSFSGSFSDFDDNLNVGVAPGCGSFTGGTDGPEAIFRVDGYSQGDTLVAELTNAPDSTTMYTLDSCPFTDGDPSDQCRGGVTGEETLKDFIDQTGPVYLVVDSTDSSESADFSLELGNEAGNVCEPGGFSCDGTGGVEQCNNYGDGIERTFNCTGSCEPGGFCSAPSTPNDTCSTARPIGDGTRLVDNYSRFNDDVSPGCVSGNNEDGEDAVYSLSVPADHSVEATVRPLGDNSDTAVYFLDSCPAGSSASCLAQDSVDNGPGDFQTVQAGYLNDSTQSETVYLVVDHDGNPENPFLLDVEVTAKECTPGSGDTQCVGPDTLGACNSYGMYEADKTCYFGCQSGANFCTTPPNDECSGAIEITDTTSYVADIGTYTNDYDADDNSSGVQKCINPQAGTPGPDAVYKVQLNEGDYFDATLTTPGNSVAWATTDCSSSTAAADACVAGENTGGGQERLQFNAPRDDTYYIMVDVNTDAGPSNPEGEFELDVHSAGDTLCDPHSRRCKSGTSDVIEYCQIPGTQYSEQTCDGSCSSGQCTQTTGDFCEDATVVQGGDSVSFTMSNYNDTYDLSSTACLPNTATDGNDRAFQIELSPGETLDVTANVSNSSDDVQIYVADACGDNSTVQNSCQTSVDSQGPGFAEFLTGFNPPIVRPTTYFVVIDGPSTSATQGQVTANFTVNSP